MFKWGLWVLGRKNTEQSSPAFSISIVQIVNKTFHCWYSSWTFGLRMVPPLWSLLFPLFCDALFGRKSLCAVHTKGRRIMHEYFEGGHSPKIFGSFLYGRFVYTLFILSLIYISMDSDIYCMFWAIIQYFYFLFCCWSCFSCSRWAIVHLAPMSPGRTPSLCFPSISLIAGTT